MKWHSEISNYVQQENYAAVSRFYEELIEAEPEIITYYWLLGLAYLLEGKEEAAHSTWLSTLMEAEGTEELIKILEEEATRQKEQGHLPESLLIREYLREINPQLVNNQLEIILLYRQLEIFTPTLIVKNGVIAVLQETAPGLVNFNLLLGVLTAILGYPALENIEFLRVSLPHISETQIFFQQIDPLILKIAYQIGQVAYAAELTELCLQLQPKNKYLLSNIYGYYCIAKNYSKAKETIERSLQLSSSIDIQLYGQYLRLDLAMKQGDWLNIEPLVKDYKTLINTIKQLDSINIDHILKQYLPSLTHLLLYIEDNPREIRQLQNGLSRLFQNDINNVSQIQTRQPKTRLKIGYLASTLRRHSVGWLTRWLFHYHNKERFEINLYLVNQKEDDITLNWFIKNAHCVRRFSPDSSAIAQQIKEDKIDILIDLESMTNAVTCCVLAIKPAPMQITWFGLDATGIPNVDYFIVDPYVVSENAQEYYQEKLWRLPQTYLAVDGFEVGVPTLTREDLNIPTDAVIYLTSQTAYKRHPDNIRLQLKIIKAVPNSYLLIKGGADLKTIETLFRELAKEEEIEAERLRFLGKDPEEIHRANLSIADIVLDTYPYNGATTTVEVLWMGIPLVTLVGEQFAARNSYTFMINAGITEGIAFNSDSYIEWGVRLGLDAELRQKIHWKLLKNRQTAPLWKAKEFTEEMEKAYLQMWNNL